MKSVFHLEYLIRPYFYTVEAIIYLALARCILAVANQPGRRHHLLWAKPFALACCLLACKRGLRDLAYFIHPTSSWGILDLALMYSNSCVSVYCSYRLWQVIRGTAPERFDRSLPQGSGPARKVNTHNDPWSTEV
jgi:hypothetical protein